MRAILHRLAQDDKEIRDSVPKIAELKRQTVEHLDRYFSGVVSAADLRAWALTQPLFANPKELDNSEDWLVSNALALMIALGDEAQERATVEKALYEAREFLTRAKPFPEDCWPVGLGGRGGTERSS
jgi:hypothetical protein